MSRRPPKSSFIALSIVLAVVLSGTLYRNSTRRHQDAARLTFKLPAIATVGDFKLMERSGKTVTLKTLLGKIWIADFIFASCAGTCPYMTERMHGLSEELTRDGLEEVMFVSISVDPARDTPQELRLYATLYHASPTRWLFLTGDKTRIEDLAVKSFKLGAPEPVPGEDQILHSSRFFLVDRAGVVRGSYGAITEEEENDLMRVSRDSPMPENEKRRLMEDIKSLIRENGPH